MANVLARRHLRASGRSVANTLKVAMALREKGEKVEIFDHIESVALNLKGPAFFWEGFKGSGAQMKKLNAAIEAVAQTGSKGPGWRLDDVKRPGGGFLI